ncbi:transmembrane protein 164-like isoform X5 [Hemitrygon akajei]|uniref:transmembrane protein 164-like isoform X5 n=1 Tax=Hemitrygon akajei TaxID=2704970 RepID=UPI003BF96031
MGFGENWEFYINSYSSFFKESCVWRFPWMTMARVDLSHFLDTVYGGVDPNITGNGGPECAAFLSVRQRALESVIMIAVSLLQIVLAYQKIGDGFQEHWNLSGSAQEHHETLGRNVLQAALCLTFGLEIGFKCASKTLIYLLNPCHVVTALQIFLLTCPPCQAVLILFRYLPPIPTVWYRTFGMSILTVNHSNCWMATEDCHLGACMCWNLSSTQRCWMKSAGQAASVEVNGHFVSRPFLRTEMLSDLLTSLNVLCVLLLLG